MLRHMTGRVQDVDATVANREGVAVLQEDRGGFLGEGVFPALVPLVGEV